jgi:hypothetical protein
MFGVKNIWREVSSWPRRVHTWAIAGDRENIWLEVKAWPSEQRLALAMRILQSLRQEEKPVAVPEEQQEALRQLIGIWQAERPPSEEAVDRILEQERMKKYGFGNQHGH